MGAIPRLPDLVGKINKTEFFSHCKIRHWIKLKITLLPNYKTYRKSENSFGIVGKRATKTNSDNMT